MEPLKLAIACQGGGSHCAFGAGVLIELLSRIDADGLLPYQGKHYRIVSLSGTSGGAINALIAWLGLTHPVGPEFGRRALADFWYDMSAHSVGDMFNNFVTVQSQRLREVLPHVESAPNVLSRWAQERILTLLEKHVPFATIPTMLGPHTPKLLIGAANVLTGQAHVFHAGPQRAPRAIEVLASTAVPNLYNAVDVDGQPYWDGLLSQNPPVRNLLSGHHVDDKPDTIWLLRINPREHSGIPQRLADITDRQNEMAGNLALEQEMFFIRQVNKWLEQGVLSSSGFKPVVWQEIVLDAKGDNGDTLDYASKLDRDPVFIEGLVALGREEARAFLGA
ncbi:MAG: patatin-like phospholipase family protein [Rhodocyclaceae bacterium]